MLSVSQKIIALFLVAQLMALFVGIFLIVNFQVFKEISITEEPSEAVNAIYIFLAILVGAVVLVVILKFEKIRDIIIRIMEFFASVLASSVVFFVFLAYFSVNYADLISLGISVFLYILKNYSDHARNFLAIFSAVGVGSIIGFSLDPLPAIIFLFLVAIYDIIAVWFTKHMVEFARYFSKQRTVFTISAKGVGEVEKVIKGKKEIEKKEISMQLGSGDIAIPAVLVVSSIKYNEIIFPIFVIIGATIGLYLVLKRAERERRIYPAMPSIAAFSIFSLSFIILIYYILGWL